MIDVGSVEHGVGKEGTRERVKWGWRKGRIVFTVEKDFGSGGFGSTRKK